MDKAEGKMGMVSMMRTAAENKAMQKAMEPTAAPREDFPYGLQITLGENELRKLGLDTDPGGAETAAADKLPNVGDELHLMAVVKVTRVSESASENQPDNCSVDLQITHMQLMAQARTVAKPGAPKKTALGG